MVVARRRLVVAGPGLMEHLMLSFSCSGSQKTRRMTGINLLLLHMRRPSPVGGGDDGHATVRYNKVGEPMCDKDGEGQLKNTY